MLRATAGVIPLFMSMFPAMPRARRVPPDARPDAREDRRGNARDPKPEFARSMTVMAAGPALRLARAV